jgi:mRNA-degrading endonuclease toxin of MazEF toxin-antitoxin module
VASDSTTPLVGSVWFVESWVLSGRDVKAGRPVVVVARPRGDRVFVIARTTDMSVKGVVTPADPGLGLTRQGVFSLRYLHSIEARHFTSNAVRHLGELPEPYASAVARLWESS